MMLAGLLPLLLALSPHTEAGDSPRVGDPVSARVVGHLEAASRGLPGELEFTVIGRAAAMPHPDQGVDLRIGPIAGRWPRPRVAVNVEHWLQDRRVRTQVVWVAVRWWRMADVHVGNAPAGTPADELAFRYDRVDLAPYGEPVDLAGLPAGQRLRHPVRAGRPLLAADFEASPDVLSGAQLQVEVARGAVRLSTVGRALADGSIGDVIPVSLGEARPPVDSVVVSSKAVRIEE